MARDYIKKVTIKKARFPIRHKLNYSDETLEWVPWIRVTYYASGMTACATFKTQTQALRDSFAKYRHINGVSI